MEQTQSLRHSNLQSFSFNQSHFPKYQNSDLKEGERLIIKERINLQIYHHKIYLNPNLTLSQLAKLIKVSIHHLSQVINMDYGQGFNSLINSCRVREAMNILQNATSCPKISDLAYEVGFNNKVSFNIAFKQFTRLTPLCYLKSNNKFLYKYHF